MTNHSTLKILGIQPKYFFRPRNTDWRQSKNLAAALQKPNLNVDLKIEFSLRNSIWATIQMNMRHLRKSICRTLKIENKEGYTVRLRDSEMRYNDVIYAYGSFPANSSKPVVWHTAPTDINLLKKRGVPNRKIQDELTNKQQCIEEAKIIALSSCERLEAFNIQFPGYRNKLAVLKFILPQLDSINPNELQHKYKNLSTVKILFVGRQAIRKGLDLVLEAFLTIKNEIPNIELTIVSDLSDGPIRIPKRPDIIWHKELPQEAIYKLMRESHIFAMPSREESFGLVYIEAMANGVALIAPNSPPQQAILGNGDFGVLCSVNIEAVAISMRKLIVNSDFREKIVVAALENYNKEYAIEAVLNSYMQVFLRAASSE